MNPVEVASEHDPRCPRVRATTPDESCQCDLIAEVEEDCTSEAMELLEDVLVQACSSGLSPKYGGTDELDSMALSAYAEGLRALADVGRVRITHEAGRRVIAERVMK